MATSTPTKRAANIHASHPKYSRGYYTRLEWHSVKVTLFPRLEGVTVSGEICKTRWKTHLVDLRRSCQHCYNHVWTRLDKSGPVLTSLDQSGQVWTSLNQSGQVWMSMKESGQVWTSLDESGRVWTCLDESWQVWKSLNKMEHDGTILNKVEHG